MLNDQGVERSGEASGQSSGAGDGYFTISFQKIALVLHRPIDGVGKLSLFGMDWIVIASEKEELKAV